MVCIKGGGYAGSWDNEGVTDIIDDNVESKKLTTTKVTRPTISRSRSSPILTEGKQLVGCSHNDVAGAFFTGSPNCRAVFAQRSSMWSDLPIYFEEEVTDIERLPNGILEDDLERKLFFGRHLSKSPRLWNPPTTDSEQYRRRLKGTVKRVRTNSVFGQSTTREDITSETPTPIIGNRETCNSNLEPTQSEKSWVGTENVLKNRIAVNSSTCIPYIKPFPSVCDACEYCKDTCELEDCRDCQMKRKNAQWHKSRLKTTPEFSRCQVRRHNRTGSLWLVCNKHVYDCTK